MTFTNADVWPQKDNERLIKLWNKGLTTYEIAKKLGRSRDAICGQARRLHQKLGADVVPSRLTCAQRAKLANERGALKTLDGGV